jgi:hypothetical protein
MAAVNSKAARYSTLSQPKSECSTGLISWYWIGEFDFAFEILSREWLDSPSLLLDEMDGRVKDNTQTV